jgi:two-component sensor histidine kinase
MPLDLSEQEIGSFELPPDWLGELLDPVGWSDVLAMFADTVNLAVALIDTDGHSLGKCHNPQPTWALAHGEKTEADQGCPFCLAPDEPCTAVADALRRCTVVMVQDKAGLAHVAIPILLGGHPMGALIAGQAFICYPEPLRLERVARLYGVSPQRLWHEAVQQVPMTEATLLLYANLLMALGRGRLAQRYSAILYRRLAGTNRTITNSLREKEVMLQEIHHRVKNNLQLVSSLLSMQSGNLDSTQDAKIIEVLQVNQQRVEAMAHIHTLLYECEQVGEIDLGKYVKDLAEILASTFQASDARIQCRFDSVPVLVAIRHAIPCGLILNELITNVFKYAYPNQEDGEICIAVKPTVDDRVSFTISDNGVGVPDGLDWKHTNSLGYRIIDSLATQIGASYHLGTEGGFSFTAEFPRETVPIGKEL